MKKTIIILTLIPLLVFAFTAEQKDAFNQANIKALEKQDLPIPTSGVRVVPQESIKMQGWQKRQMLDESKQMRTKGYIEKTSTRAYELMNIKAKIIKIEARQKVSLANMGTSSHMRQSPEDIPFAYTYIGAPIEDMIEFYGIAPVGTYVEEPLAGWTGAVEFFKTSFGYCAYTENNLIAAHGAARIAEEEAQNDVNGKITLIDIEGNDSTGYLYRVNWFDNVFNRNLECAAKNFSQDVRGATINLAKEIDSKVV